MKKLFFPSALFCLAFLFFNAWQPTTGQDTPRSFIAFGEKIKKLPKDANPEKKEVKDDKVAKADKGPLQHLKYRLIGPAAGGRVSRACGVPGDPSIYYVAASAGGVWKTTDGGLSWKSVFDDQPTASIGAIAVAPSDPNVVYVGSGEANIRGNVMAGAGIFKSTDAGKTWKHVWIHKGQIGHLIVHPANPDIAFAAVLGHAFGPNPERGVYRTTDGGKTWKQVLTKVVPAMKVSPAGGDIQEENVGAVDVTFDPNNPRILFAALWQTRRTPWSLTSGGPGSGLWRSGDGGDSWKALEPGKEGLPEGPWGRIGVAIAPSDSRRIYALIEAEKGGLFRSDDAGEKWKLMSGAHYLRQRPWYFSTVHVDPANPDVVWCPNVRLLKSVDGGRTFKNLKGPHHPDHHDLWIDPKNPRRMIDSNDGGIDITLNAGESWHAPALPIAQFYHINVDNSVPYRVLGNMQDQGTASGPSNSLSSAGISLSDWHTVGGGETGFSIADPKDPNLVYSGEYGGYLSRYDHRIRQARNISIYPTNPSGKGAEEMRYRFQWTAPILISPHDHSVLYHGANVLFRSKDAGTTWDKISPDLTRDDKSKQKWSGGPITGDNTTAEFFCTIFALAESPKKPGVLWAGSDDGLVHVSLDAGKKWDNVTKNIPGLPAWATIACIEASPHDPARAYVVADAHRLDDDRPYLWTTADYGKTWQSLTKPLPQDDYLRVVREDPQVSGILYLGSEHHVSFSRDRGETWMKLKQNMPTAAICDLHVKDNDLVVGTNGRSIWILDDLTPIRQWTAKIEAQASHLFPPPPALQWHYHGESYVGEDRIPGDNPPKGALVTYYLDKKPKKEIVLEIFDADGKLVQKLTSKKVDPEAEDDAPDVPWSIYKPTVLPDEPGVQRVAWNFLAAGPKIIPGAKNDAGVPHQGPRVPPGTYTLKLHVDDRVLTANLELRTDPRVKLRPEQLAEQYQFARQIRDDITQLSETVLSLRSVRRQIQDRTESLKDAPAAQAWVKQTGEMVKKLDALEEKLHNPKAEVTYDILAQKGGAKLYSQLAPLLDSVKESHGVITQGMREVHAELAKELNLLTGEWRQLVREDLIQLNAGAERSRIPGVVLPPLKDE